MDGQVAVLHEQLWEEVTCDNIPSESLERVDFPPPTLRFQRSDSTLCSARGSGVIAMAYYSPPVSHVRYRLTPVSGGGGGGAVNDVRIGAGGVLCVAWAGILYPKTSQSNDDAALKCSRNNP